MVPHTSLEGVNLGVLLVAAGMVMMAINRAIILNVDPQELNVAIHLVGILLIIVCTKRMSTVRRYTCQSVGT